MRTGVTVILAAFSMAALFPNEWSPLLAASNVAVVDAAKSGDLEKLRSLIQNKANLNQPHNGTRALDWAVHRNDPTMVDLLIQRGADVNASNDYGVTPLALACTNGNAQIVETLLEAGADPNSARWSGETVLMSCASAGNVRGVRLLLDRGADPNARETKKGQTALMWAVAEKHPEVTRVLVEAGADIHARSKTVSVPPTFSRESTNIYGQSYDFSVLFPESKGGFSALLFAARVGDLASAKVLLDSGADVNESTPVEGSVLVVAAASGHEQLALHLLRSGADPNAKDAWGVTPLHYAVHHGLLNINGARRMKTDRFGWERPNLPELAKALLARGADPNAIIQYDYPPYDNAFIARGIGNDHVQMSLVGMTPVLLAAASGDVGLMRTLVEGGGDAEVETTKGVTPLMLAAGFGIDRGKGDEKSALETLQLAVALGGDVNARKEDGRTAVHAAAFLGWHDVIRYLAEQGANLDAKDMYGQTPISIALGDPEGLIYRQLPGGRYDDRFRDIRPRQKTAELLVELGAAPFTGQYRDRSGQ